MICEPCRERNHDGCPNGTWCDCQHKKPVGAEDTESPLGAVITGMSE